MAVRPTKLYKIVVVGEEGVGRRSIISKYTNDGKPFDDSKLKRKIVELDSDTIEIEILYEDIYGTKWRHLDLLTKCGIMLVYDVTSNESFEIVENLDWLPHLEFGDSATKRLLLGNKVDLESQRVVPKEKGKQLAQEGNMPFLETSAITGSNIDKAFETIISNIETYHMDHPLYHHEHEVVSDSDSSDSDITDSDSGADETSNNNVLAERNVSFTSDTNNNFILQQCGLSLYFPLEIITTPVESPAVVSYDVTAKGLWAEQFVFPEGTQLISSVTSVSLNAPLPLDKPVTVQLMHCASITDQSQSKYLSFVVSHSVQPPFKFELLPGGDFLPGSRYGTIQLKEFSLIAIVLVISGTAAIATAIGFRFSQVPLLRCQGLIYYKRESENMKMNFAVLNDLPHNNAIIKFKKESYKKFGVEEWNFPFQMRKGSQLELHFPSEKPDGWTVQPLGEPSIIHERYIRIYTESNTSSDLPPYISVILQATPTAAERLDYKITVNGINIGDKDSIAIAVRKSRNACTSFTPSLEPAPAVIEKSNEASEVFREKVFTLSSIIGSGTSTIFDRISDEFFSAGLISQSILDDITTVPSYSNYQRGSRLIHEVYRRLQTIDAPNDNLIVVCDILTRQEDEQLVQIGEDMKKNASHPV